ncbi:hypothetical protein D5R95_05670, partial [Methanosalsum natronophilum]
MCFQSLKIQGKKFLSKNKINFFVLGLYILLTYIMVYLPVSIDLSKTYLGHGEVVFWSNYFWWFDYAVTNGLNPLHHSYIFYPLGLDLVDSILPPFLFIPITHIFGSILSYNLYVLCTFILAGYGMFLLAKYLFEDPHAAFIAGIIFAFFPFHFGASMGHIHTLSILWIPFFVLFFFKMYEDPNRTNILLASLFFAMNALSSWTIAVMLGIFSLMFMIYQKRQTISRDFLPKLGLFFLVSILFSAPGLYYMLKNMLINEHMIKSLNDYIYYSADIVAFFIPSPLHPLLNPITDPIYSNFTGNYSENIVFIGYTVLILSIIGMRVWMKDSFGKFILICTGVFFILSLGPVLHFFGVWQFTEFNLTIMLPGVVTYYVPFLNMIRVPSRYSIMIMFFISLIAAFGFKYLTEKFSGEKGKKFALCSIIVIMILFEFITILPVQDVKSTPDFYYSISNDDDAPIMEIPFIRLSGSPLDQTKGITTMMTYYEYQKTHQRPIFSGYWSRMDHIYYSFIKEDPVLFYVLYGSEDIIQSSISDKLAYLKYNYNISYVILHKNYLDENNLDTLITYLGDSYTVDSSVQDDQLIIYNTGVTSEESIVSSISRFSLGDGWHGLEHWQGVPSRWISENATLIIVSNTDQQIVLSYNTQSFYRPRTMEIYANDHLIQQTAVPTSFVSISIPIQLQKGENIIWLHVPGGAERPCDIPELNNRDTRRLSVAVQNIKIEEVITSLPTYELGTPIIFGVNGTAQQYQLTGWSGPEEGFTWTSGYQAGLALQM